MCGVHRPTRPRRSANARGFTGPSLSREQALPAPFTAAAQRVPNAIVQAVLPSLPELDDLRAEPEAAPEVRERGIVAELLLGLGEPAFQCGPIGKRLVLQRCPRSQSVSHRARFEIGFGLLAWHFRHRAAGGDLA